MKASPKRVKNLKLGAIIIAAIFLNPLALYVYLMTFLGYRQLHLDQPKIQNNFESFQVPTECIIISKRTVAGSIDSNAYLQATYKCDVEAQVVYGKLASTYKPELVNMPSGNPAFSSGPYVFNLFSSQAAAENDGEPKDTAVLTTNPVFLSVAVFPE